ncbi:hypothetical protein LOK49_LG06G00106 [Camellia lanceoleosa]|uniref:Uncharacterized protein n=1 Tax=Camellia lanceoleosa TaxID=1840588 RepID=A0ACC0HJA7_9ERIC|nr:hypothetical protein LOK49_LG06G00106 [Camellia lanceoleosa]
MIVRMATERVYPDAERFKAYAILSDGVVIGDTRVAVEYKSMLIELQFSTVKEGSLKHALTLDEDGKEAFPKPLVVEEMICQTSRDLKEVFEYDEAPEDVLQWAISQTKVLAMIGNMTPLTIRVTSEQKTETQELNLSP